jgi:hypothetical protein
MNCIYCQASLKFHDFNSRINSGFLHCDDCNVNYHVKDNIILTITLRSKPYIVDIYVPENNCMIYDIHGEFWPQLLFRLSHIPPNWNPQNINEKIKQLLVFL